MITKNQGRIFKTKTGLTAMTSMVKDFISQFLSLIRQATVPLNNLEFDCSKTPPFNRTTIIYALKKFFQGTIILIIMIRKTAGLRKGVRR